MENGGDDVNPTRESFQEFVEHPFEWGKAPKFVVNSNHSIKGVFVRQESDGPLVGTLWANDYLTQVALLVKIGFVEVNRQPRSHSKEFELIHYKTARKIHGHNVSTVLTVGTGDGGRDCFGVFYYDAEGNFLNFGIYSE